MYMRSGHVEPSEDENSSSTANAVEVASNPSCKNLRRPIAMESSANHKKRGREDARALTTEGSPLAVQDHCVSPRRGSSGFKRRRAEDDARNETVGSNGSRKRTLSSTVDERLPVPVQVVAGKKQKCEEETVGAAVVNRGAGGAMDTQGSSVMSASEGTDCITNMLKQCHFESNARKEQSTVRKEQAGKRHHDKWEAEQLQQNQDLGSMFLERRQRKARAELHSTPPTTRTIPEIQFPSHIETRTVSCRQQLPTTKK